MKLFQKSLINVMSYVVLFAYPIKLNISTKNTVTKILPKKLYCILSDLCNAIKKILDKILCRKHFKIYHFKFFNPISQYASKLTY